MVVTSKNNPNLHTLGAHYVIPGSVDGISNCGIRGSRRGRDLRIPTNGSHNWHRQPTACPARSDIDGLFGTRDSRLLECIIDGSRPSDYGGPFCVFQATSWLSPATQNRVALTNSPHPPFPHPNAKQTSVASRSERPTSTLRKMKRSVVRPPPAVASSPSRASVPS